MRQQHPSLKKIKKQCFIYYCFSLVGLACLLFSSQLIASPIQPIPTTLAANIPNTPPAQTFFMADKAECKETADQGNICIYQGNAQFIDETTKLIAPTITVTRNSANEIIQINAQGDSLHQAYYQCVVILENKPSASSQLNKTNKNPISATANMINIYPPKNLMTLDGQAKVIRNQDVITGSFLEYDTKQQTILATPKDKELTTIILQPRVKTPELNKTAP